MSKNQEPYISPDTHLPEITVKGVILGIILSAVLAAANAYLGLFAGMTVSASIPAAVISMAILRLFKKSNILENNAVQTAASAGESLAAGVIFTFPALVIMGYWQDFDYFQTTFIALCGGILGVLFTIPLRSALIVRQKLTFPEGLATAEVLKTGTEGGKGIKFLLIAGIVGALFKLCEAGFRLWHYAVDVATVVKGKLYLMFSINCSPALVAVGYIVGLRIAALVFIGGVITWWVAIPIYMAMNGYDGVVDELIAAGKYGSAADANAGNIGITLWSAKMRYLGVGAMLIGGVWALISIKDALLPALREGVAAFKKGSDDLAVLPRTEQDTPMKWVVVGIGLLIIPIFIIYLREIEVLHVSGTMAIIMVFGGFLFSAVAGYMAGLVGSSNNPISGVTIATVLTAALLLAAMMGTGSAKGPAAAIMIGAVVCCAAAIAGDNMQDLKAGHLLGATPRKQQIMQVVGVVASALVIALVLSLLNNAYGFGPDSPLQAPQATLMQSIAEGVFGGNLPWNLIFIGIAIGALIIMADLYQKRRGSSFRIPVLAVAVGLYLPFELDSAIMLGGIIAWLVSRYQQSQGGDKVRSQRSNQTGLLFASGLITGEALMGIGIAVPVAATSNLNVLQLIAEPLGGWLGLLLLLAICYWLYNTAVQAYKE
ncbi:MAG: oligopeptide transporter, OPT family [Bacteroidota bacterium]